MRLLTLPFSFLLTATLATAALGYVSERVGQNRIVVQDSWISSSEPVAYRAYGQADTTDLDSLANAVADRDTTADR